MYAFYLTLQNVREKSWYKTLFFVFPLTPLLVDELEVFLAEDEGVGEIFLTYNLVGSQLFGVALKENLALEKQVGAIGDGERFLHVVVGDENADVAVFQLPDDVLDVFHGNRVDSGKGLVEHDELRFDG